MNPLKKETPKLLNKEEAKQKLIEGIETLWKINAELKEVGERADQLTQRYLAFKKKTEKLKHPQVN